MSATSTFIYTVIAPQNGHIKYPVDFVSYTYKAISEAEVHRRPNQIAPQVELFAERWHSNKEDHSLMPIHSEHMKISS